MPTFNPGEEVTVSGEGAHEGKYAIVESRAETPEGAGESSERYWVRFTSGVVELYDAADLTALRRPAS